MNKAIIIFLMTIIVFGCAKGNYNISPPLSYIDQNKVAVLEFLARPASVTSPGHAYIKLIREDENKQMSTRFSYGFYPDDDSKFFQIFSTRGELKSESEAKSPPSIMVKTMLNTQQLEGVLLTIDRWELEAKFGFKKYRLTTQNCINFVSEIASEAGLITPPPTKVEFPTQYIDNLAKSNR